MVKATSRVQIPWLAMFSLLLLCGCGAGTASHFAGTATTASASTSSSTGSTATTSSSSTGSSSTPTSNPSVPGAPPTTPTAPPPTTPAPAPGVPGYAEVMALPFQAGITHTDGRYGFVGGNFLVEGAQKIVDLGSPAIFLYMTPNFRGNYPDRGTPMWPTTNPASLTELAQTAPYRQVFNMPFKTFVITAYTMANGDNYSQAATDPNAAAAEEKEFYDFAHYLFTTFAGTGKTFILKTWEGDFIALGGFDASQDLSQTAVDHMVAWLKSRQHGVTRARQDAGNVTGVGVFNAVECSLVLDFARGQSKVRVINAVVPQVAADMVTYSSWDSTMQGTDPASAAAALNEALDTIKKYTPDPLNLGNRRILISEYGLYEKNRPTETVWRAQTILDTAKSAGLLGAFFWELFDNECTDSSGNYFPVGSLPGAAVRPSSANCDGLSIVRPDGSTSPALPVLAAYWKQ